uniref:Uncharacterized protein n=1 Tax=Arundo donax TaxID=35708 RepID=A0A0A9DTH1_ARUDO
MVTATGFSSAQWRETAELELQDGVRVGGGSCRRRTCSGRVGP